MSAIDLPTLRAWARNGLDTANDAALQRCLDEAVVEIDRLTGRTFAKATFTVYLDGDAADGREAEILRLPAGRQPLRYNGTTDLVVVVENGVTLTVARGYSTTAHVILRGVDEDVTPALIRQPTQAPLLVADEFQSGWRRWAPGRQNISVTYPAGYVAGSYPEDAVGVIFELAWLHWNAAAHSGKSSKSKAGSSVTITGDLTPTSQRAIAALRVAA